MVDLTFSRRALIVGAGFSVLLPNAPGRLSSTVQAATNFAPTQSMLGGSNNYIPKAPMVDNLGKGFTVSGTVRRAGSGDPLAGVRIQIWAATNRGGEQEPTNRGSVVSDANGLFRLEMSQILPNFGQPHAHLAYDDGAFQTVFLRPLLGSKSDTSVQAHFLLA